MKKHGFLQTFSPNAELKKDNTQPKNPLDNFTIIFMGPEGSDIHPWRPYHHTSDIAGIPEH